MQNCMLGFPNRIDSATLSGGAWVAGLPLNNLKNRIIGKVARTTNLDLVSTQYDVDLGSSKFIRTLSYRKHNFSLAAKYRVRASDVSNFATSLYDSGWLDVWPAVYPSATLPWEASNWWSGKYADEEISGYVPELVHVLPGNLNARYWRNEFDDQNNAAGYLQIGRQFIGPAWQPTFNMSYGASIGWETKTAVQESLGGAEYFQARAPYRVANFVLDLMDQDEAFARAFELQRRAGIDQEVLFIHDPDDTVHALRRRFLGRMRQLSPVEYPYYNGNKAAFQIKELL